MRPRLFLGAHVCVLAFSTTDRKSFEAIESWKHKVEIFCHDVISEMNRFFR